MFNKQSAKTKIGLFLMTILCAVTLGFGVSTSVKASSDLDEYDGTTDPSLTQYMLSETQQNHKKYKYIPYEQMCVYHLKKGHKYYQTYQWDTKDNRAQLIREFYIDNKLGGKTVVAPKTTKYDIKVKGVKYRPVTWYHNYSGNHSYVKESTFKRSFRKGGYFNDTKAEGIGFNLTMKNSIIKHIPVDEKSGIAVIRNADEAAESFGFKNNKCYELFNLTADLNHYYMGDINMSASLLHEEKARYQQLAGKPYKYVPYEEKDNSFANEKAKQDFLNFLKD